MKKLRVIMAVMSMVLAALMAFTACGGSPETITFEAPVRLAVTAQSSSGSSGFSTLSETESASETWLLNESLDFSRFNIIEDITYESKGQSWTHIDIDYDNLGVSYSTSGGSVLAHAGSWTDNGYRILTFAESPTGDLLSFLELNGVKVRGAERVTASITPENATNKKVNWTVNWKATNIANDIADYLEVIPDRDGSLTATVVCLQRFLYDAVVTVTSRADSTKKAEIICKCKSGYVIQAGNYVFAAEPEPMLFEESLNFRTYYKSYSTMSWVSVSRVGQLQYGDTAVYYQSGELPGWEREYYRAVYIDEDQDVSADFYTWFNANTVKAELSGKWQWNESLSNPNDIGNAGAPSVNFVSNGKEYDSYTFFYDKATDSQIQYRVDSSSDLVYENGVWKDEAYRILDFGETPQEVDGTFYIYFTANAVPYEEPATYTIEAGEYKCVDSPTQPDENMEVSLLFSTVSGTACNLMRVTVRQDIVYVPTSGDFVIKAYNTGLWGYESDKRITVVNDATGISESFYNWFTANYLPYEEPATYTIEAGTYVGNDTITTTAFEKVGILFSCDGVSYYGMERTSSQLRYYLITDLFNLAYEKSWEDVSYRTIQVEKYVTENESFYNWFTANYLPYEEPATYTIEAGTYQAKEELGTTSNFNIDLNFTSNGQSFSDMNTSGITRAPEATFNYDSQIVYMIDTKTWINDNYRTIVIDTAQTVTDESFYNWFTANYLPYEEPETSLITVRYTENTVAGTVTITNRSDFAGYVEVTVSTLAGASIYITTAADTSEGYYKLEANQTRTLNVGGDWPEQQRGDDLIATVTPVLYVEPALITFTINGIEYQAEEGMTWSEWVESSYNTGSNLFYKSGSTAYIKDMMYEWCVCYDSAKVVATDVIIAGAAYDLME